MTAHDGDRQSFTGEAPGYGRLLLLLPLLLSLFLAAPSAYAHRVNVFAWVEGDRLHVQGSFSGGKGVREGTVRIYDLKGTLIAEGKTNAEGACSFALRKREPLRVVVLAGAGHRGEWRLTKEDWGEGGPQAGGEVSTPEKPPERSTPPSAVPATAISREALMAAVETALDHKLKPFYALLAKTVNRGPTATEIFGGIGYIVGLVGLSAYLRTRKRGKGDNPR